MTELTIEQALQQGIEAHKAGQVQKADRLYTAILEAQPKHPYANHNMGVLAVSVGRVELAVPFFKTALEANPNMAQFWLSYLDALIKLEKLADAKAVLDQAKSKGAKGDGLDKLEKRLKEADQEYSSDNTLTETLEANQISTLDAAIQLRESGEFNRAIDLLKDKINQFPEDVDMLALLSHCYLLADQIELAKLYLDKAKKISPDNASVRWNTARLTLKEKKPLEALSVARDTSQKFPDDVEGMGVLGASLRANNEIVESLEILNRAIELNPSYVEALINRGLIRLSQENKPEALADLELAHGLKPHIKQIWDLVIGLKVEAQEYSDAIELLINMITIDPEDEKRFSLLAACIPKVDDSALAVKSYQKVLEVKPGSAAIHANLGIALKKQGETEQAITYFKKALAINPDYAEAYYNMGATLQEQGKLEEAIEAYQKALAIKPNNAGAYNNMGTVLQERGKLEEAIQAYQRALTIKPKNADALLNMGNALKRQGKLEEAIQAYNKAIEIKHNYADAYNNMGTVLQEQGKLEEAIQAYQRALTIKPKNADALLNMGNALKHQGKLEEAIQVYNKAIEIKHNYADAYYNMGATLQEQGKLKEAIEAYQKALAIKPGNAEAYNNTGNALTKQGKLKEAIQAYRKALAIKPDDAETYNNIGTTLQEQSKLEEAIEAFNKALAIKPDYAEAARNLVKLPIGSVDKKTISELNKKLSLISPNIDGRSEKLFFEANLLSHKGMFNEAFKVFLNANHVKSRENISCLKGTQKKYEAAVKRISRWSVNPRSRGKARVKKLLLLGPSRSGKSTLEKLLIRSPNVCPMFENINLNAAGESERTTEEPQKLSMVDLFYHDENRLLRLGYNAITSTRPETMFQIDRLVDRLSDSFYIFVKRNRINVASEIFTKEYTKGNFYSYDHSSILEYLDAYEAIWKIIKLKAPHLILEISFEDILSKPQNAIKKISKLTGVSFEESSPPNQSITNLPSPFAEHYALHFMAP